MQAETWPCQGSATKMEEEREIVAAATLRAPHAIATVEFIQIGFRSSLGRGAARHHLPRKVGGGHRVNGTCQQNDANA